MNYCNFILETGVRVILEGVDQLWLIFYLDNFGCDLLLYL